MAFLDPVPDALDRLVMRHARTHGPFTSGRCQCPAGSRRRRRAGAAGRERRADRGRLPAGRQRPRVRRARGAATAAAAHAGPPAPRGRAGRAGGAGPVPARLARHRPRPARRQRLREVVAQLEGWRPACGRDRVGHPARARVGLPARLARPGLRRRRAGLDRRRPGPGAAVPARERAAAAPPSRGARASAPGRAGTARSLLLRRPGGRRRRAPIGRYWPTCGSWCGLACHQRRLGAAARRHHAAIGTGRRPVRRAAGGRDHRLAASRSRPLVAGGAAASACGRSARNGRGRWPRCCWNATASSPAPPCWPRACLVVSRRCTASCGRWRRRACASAGTSSRVWAVRSSRCRRPSSGCATCARPIPEPSPWCWRAADPANPFGVTAPWPDAARKPARAAGAWLALVEGRPAVYVEKGGRGLVTLRTAPVRRGYLSAGRCCRRAAASAGSPPSASTAVRSTATPPSKSCSTTVSSKPTAASC